VILKNIKRICIIGFGSIGRKHFSIVREMYPEIEIILVRSGKGKNFEEEKFAKKIVNNIDEAINFSPEAAFICTPATLHLIQATKLIEKNIPILIEKPLSDSSIGIKDLKILANQSNAVILVGYVLRYSESLKFFKKMIDNKLRFNFDSADINCQSFLPDWRPNQDYKKSPSANKKLGGGVLLELSHEIDYANWIFGGFKNVRCKLENTGILDIDVEDNASLKLVSNKNIDVNIDLNFSQKEKVRECIYKNKEYSIKWDGIKDEVILKRKNSDPKIWSFKSGDNEIYKKQIKHFFKCVIKSEKPQVSLDESIEVLNIVEMAKKSNNQNRKIII